MNSAHAFLPPSGASSWVVCALWPTMNYRFPQDDTESSREGTAAHFVFVEIFYQRPVALGQVAPNGVTLTLEMLDGADIYVDVIDADLRDAGLSRQYLAVEQRVNIPAVHVENWGTPDTWFYDAARRRLHVYDYKFGHDFVDGYRNWQCVDYVLGIIDTIAAWLGEAPAVVDQSLTVDIVIIQPRNYDRDGPIRRWTVRGSDLREMANKLLAAAERALDPNPAATPGEQCEHCPGRHACNVLQRQGYRAARLARQSVPAELPPAALGIELAILEEAKVMLDARISGLQEQTISRIARGEPVQGYGLDPTYGRQGWKAPVGQVLTTGRLFGVELAKEAAVTPLQAIKLGVPPAIVASMSDTPSKGLKLVRDTGNKASKVFGKVN